MVARDVLISHQIDNGDGTLTVHFLSPAGVEGHVHIGRDMLTSAHLYPLLRVQAARLDAKANALGVANVTQIED